MIKMNPIKEIKSFQATQQKQPFWVIFKRAPRIIRCPNCGYTGKGQGMIEGSTWLELFLWILLIVPGLIYSIWRWTCGQYTGCPKCGWKYVEKTWL